MWSRWWWRGRGRRRRGRTRARMRMGITFTTSSLTTPTIFSCAVTTVATWMTFLGGGFRSLSFWFMMAAVRGIASNQFHFKGDAVDLSTVHWRHCLFGIRSSGEPHHRMWPLLKLRDCLNSPKCTENLPHVRNCDISWEFPHFDLVQVPGTSSATPILLLLVVVVMMMMTTITTMITATTATVMMMMIMPWRWHL